LACWTWDGGAYVEHFARNYDDLVEALRANRSEFAENLEVEPIPERNSGKGEVQFVRVVLYVVAALAVVQGVSYFF
jgi:hypothetical protein